MNRHPVKQIGELEKSKLKKKIEVSLSCKNTNFPILHNSFFHLLLRTIPRANGIAEIWVKIFSCKLGLLTEIYSPDIGALPKLQAQYKLILTPLWGVYSVQCFYLRAKDQNLILAFNQMNSLFWHTKEEFSLNREDWSVVLPLMVFIYHFLFYNLGLEGERDNQWYPKP